MFKVVSFGESLGIREGGDICFPFYLLELMFYCMYLVILLL